MRKILNLFPELTKAAVACARLALPNCPTGERWVPLAVIEAVEEGSNRREISRAAGAANALANTTERWAQRAENSARAAAYAADVALAAEVQYARRGTVDAAYEAVKSAYGQDRGMMREKCQRILSEVGLECHSLPWWAD